MTAKRAIAKGMVGMALAQWGLDGHPTMADAGEVLLKLVTQSAWRANLYGQLLGEAYEAAEALQAACAEAQVIMLPGAELAEDPRVQQAVANVGRVFTVGGVGALVGWKHDADRFGRIYQVEESIRGLAALEAAERDRCAKYAAAAVNAGLAERQVRLAERQGVAIVGAIRQILDELELSIEQQDRVAEIVGRNLRAIAGDVIEG